MNAERLQQDYARVINGALEGKPADMTVTTHVCRGNFRSTWISEGGYEPVAEIMLGKLNYDGYFLEYDTARAGGFEPLRFLPKGNKIVVLGLVTTKSGTLEKKDDVKRRIEEATKYAALDQLSSVAAMRLRLHRRRQRACRGRAMGEAAHDRRARRTRCGADDLSFRGGRGASPLCGSAGMTRARPSRLCTCTIKAMANSGVARLTIGIETKAAINSPPT